MTAAETSSKREHTSDKALRYVQYGCGWSVHEEWTNFDASLTLKWERLPLVGRAYTKNSQRFPSNAVPGDIVSGLPVPDNSCRGVYASHVLEHLALEDFHRALQNTYRILADGGIFRLIVPDLERFARDYIARLEQGDPKASDFFMQASALGYIRRDRGVVGMVRKLFNSSAHLWMWDELSMFQALREHGFRAIRHCRFGDCEDDMFSRVESSDRFENALAVEARR